MLGSVNPGALGTLFPVSTVERHYPVQTDLLSQDPGDSRPSSLTQGQGMTKTSKPITRQQPFVQPSRWACVPASCPF